MPKVFLKSLFPTRTMFFTARVNIRDGKNIVNSVNITQGFDIYMGAQRDDNPCWVIRFDADHPIHYIQWYEKDGEGKTTVDKQKKSAAEWLCKHEQVRPLFGDTNTNIRGEAYYTLEFEGKRNTYQADLNNRKFAVYEKFKGLTANEKRDCAFYYVIPATGMKHSELIVKMSDYTTGFLMSTDIKKGEKLSPMEHFLTLYGKESISEIKLLSEKAIAYNLITKNERGFWFAEEYIGTSTENVYDYINANASIKDTLKREVGKNEVPVEDDMVATVKSSPFVKDPQRDQKIKDQQEIELNALKEKAKALGIEFAGVKGRAKLLEEIEKAEKLQTA